MQRVTLNGELVLYRSKDGSVQLEAKLERDSVWITQKQMADLFATERSVITKHLRNIFNTKELSINSVGAKYAHTAEDGKTYQTQFYNLDAIISVGYRVNSKRGTEFRIWATRVLRDHLVKGYTENPKRLAELKQTLTLVAEISKRKNLSGDEAAAILQTISDYARALDLLDDYDHQRVRAPKGTVRSAKIITHDEALKIIERMKKKYKSGKLFGMTKDESLHSSLGAVMQSFSGRDVYPSLEDKAANLLYFLVKNHSFVDGNKRIAAVIFLYFLEKNNLLYCKNGSQKIDNNALVAITLMIAESKPTEKNIITAMVANLIHQKD